MVVAWRAWALEEQPVPRPSEDTGHPHAHAMGWRLISVGNDTEYSMWRPDESPPAQCLLSHAGQTDPHAAPQQDCRCGYYAYSTLEDCLLAFTPDHLLPEVIGEVRLSGRIVRSGETYRAEFAYPTRLIVIDRPWRDVPTKARELGAYGVPVEVRPHPENKPGPT